MLNIAGKVEKPNVAHAVRDAWKRSKWLWAGSTTRLALVDAMATCNSWWDLTTSEAETSRHDVYGRCSVALDIESDYDVRLNRWFVKYGQAVHRVLHDQVAYFLLLISLLSARPTVQTNTYLLIALALLRPNLSCKILECNVPSPDILP